MKNELRPIILRYQHFGSLGTYLYASFMTEDEALQWAMERGWVHTDPANNFPPKPYFTNFQIFRLAGDVQILKPTILPATLIPVANAGEPPSAQ